MSANARLIEAANDGVLSSVENELQAGANVNFKGDYDDTALNKAAENGHKEVVMRLLEAGADINNKGSADKTPLVNAVVGGHPDIVQLLIDRGALVSNDALSIIDMKVNILEENCEAGFVTQEGLDAWKGFQSYLKKMRLKQDLPEILRGLSSPEPELRKSAVEFTEKGVIAGLDISPGLDPLKKILKDPDDENHHSAAAALCVHYIQSAAWSEVSQLRKSVDAEGLLGVMSIFVSASRSAFDISPLMDDILFFMKHESEDLRHDAPIVVGYLATNGFEIHAAVQPIIEALNDSVAAIRQIAAWAIYRMVKYSGIDMAKPLPRIKELTEDENEDVQNMAREVLALVEQT